MDNTTYQQIIGEIGTLITIFAPLLTAYKLALALGLDNYIESKITLIKDDNLRKIAENIKTRVENITVNTITMIEAVEKPIIMESIKNGSMTKDDLTNLKTKAIETIKSQLTNEGQTDLQNTVGDTNTYLNTLIEAKLAQLKIDSTSPISKTVLPEVITPVVDTSVLTNQINQLQSDKDVLAQQIAQVTSDKANIEQTNAQLSSQVDSLNIQVSQLANDKQTVQAKLDSINATLNQGVQTVVANNTTTETNTQTIIN